MHFTVECSYEKCTAIRTRTSAHLCCYPFYQLHCCVHREEYEVRGLHLGTGNWGTAPSPAALGPTMDSLFVAVFRSVIVDVVVVAVGGTSGIVT